MKQSPLDLQNLSFLAVHIDLDQNYTQKDKNYDFEGTSYFLGIKHGRIDESKRLWWVGVEYGIKSDEDKTCPYNITIKAAGKYRVSQGFPSETEEKLVYENGAAIIYSAIRELVSTITCRSGYGELMLPTASFVGTYAEYLKEKETSSTQQED